jgi:N-acetylglucosamine transport system substrate-binding protein
MLDTFESFFGEDARSYSLKGSASKNHLAAQISFAAGEAAMIPNGNWIETETGDSFREFNIEIRMMRVPYLSDAKKDEAGEFLPINYSATPDYMIVPAAATNKEGAKKFLAYMCRDDILKLYTEATGAPRPFDYDVEGCDTSEFVKSCLDIWANSESWFDYSHSPMYANGYAKKYLTVSPYVPITYGELVPALFCNQEWTRAQSQWDAWKAASGL